MSQRYNAEAATSDSPVVPTGERRKHNRSRKGCWTCRRRKVKCDETSPTCKKCSRLELTCTWVQTSVPLKERRRGLGSIKSRDNWIPSPIRPDSKGSVQLDGSVASASPFPSASIIEPDLISSDAAFDSAVPTNLDHWDSTEVFNDPYQALSAALTPETLELDLDHQRSLSQEGEGGSSLVDIDESGTVNVYGHFNSSQQAPLLTAAIPTLSTYHIPLPNALTLSRAEHSAVDYYQHTFSIHMTTKEPTWSTNAILLRVGVHNPMVMHLLLSSMLSEMALNQPKADLLIRAAQQHYRAGVQRLMELMSGTEEPDHVVVMAAFWFLYVCSRRRKEMTFRTMSQLSMAVKNHIEMFSLHKLIAAPRTSSSQQITHSHSGRALSPKDQSLLARLIIWTYYLDVQYSFRGCRGALANFLQTNPDLSDEIYDRSRSVLELNWGTSYPISQAIDDMENSPTLDLLYKLWKAVQLVNQGSQSGQPPEAWAPGIEEQLSKMETEYSTVFRLATTPVTPRNRLLCNIDWVVSHFYALRIYLFHCAYPPSISSPDIIREAVKSLLDIARRTLAHGVNDQRDRMQWPLFLAGMETEDPIHRDWILGKMPESSQLRATLEAIVQVREGAGGIRVTAEAMRDIMCLASTAGALGSGKWAEIGEEGWGEAQIACMF